MQNNLATSNRHLLFSLLVFFSMSIYSNFTFAWGHDGHGTVGVLAVNQLKPSAYERLQDIMGPLNLETMLEACNWPDDVRETDEWAWSYPLHYINIPRGDTEYLQSRDCPQQLCASEAIKAYAKDLGNREASPEERQQAFAWLCHISGDLHQPLHAGFADDRGGNDIEVIFRGEHIDLHELWDSRLISQHAENGQQLTQLISAVPEIKNCGDWTEDMVDDWTNESHQLAKEHVYPATENIDAAYEQRNWLLIQKQLRTASSRLAQIVNTVLAKTEIRD